MNFTINIAKAKKHNTNSKPRKISELCEALVIVDENGVYKAKVGNFDEAKIYSFTEDSLNLKGKTRIFSKNKDEHGNHVCIIRSIQESKLFPQSSEHYLPFVQGRYICGYIVTINGFSKFQFKHNKSGFGSKTELENKIISHYADNEDKSS